ncbi:MAG: hypothetical protein M0008_05915 [Actinomycetota bacterium]|nr:hypothetical protein [Actinomycetota bacterium]
MTRAGPADTVEAFNTRAESEAVYIPSTNTSARRGCPVAGAVTEARGVTLIERLGVSLVAETGHGARRGYLAV